VAQFVNPNSPQLDYLQSSHKADAGILREGFVMHIHEGRNLFAVEHESKNMLGIEHYSYAPTFHDALDC
jgi:hypothetical protein